jgi:demethylmenaquinone methyltransferase/2-methoxy-6-polyprenyl-1,4-benzoquinol methylase
MSSTDLASPDKTTIRRLFDEIAFRYDFLNSFLSFRMDSLWRRKARKIILDGTESKVLDLGVGTGKFLGLFMATGKFKRAVGLDFSFKMLQRAAGELPDAARLVSADFHALPFKPESFDVVISSFTLRSVKVLSRFFDEIYEILTPHGKAAFLCLTRPQGLFKLIYYPYLKFYLPLMGKLLTGNSEAYRFLSQSIQTFQEPGKTMDMLRQRGFQSIEIKRLSFGIATLIVARK